MGIKKDAQEERIYEGKKADYENKIRILKAEIDEVDESDRNETLEIEAFMSILCNADSYYKKASYVQKRKITKILFSNILLDHRKRLHIAVKPGLEQLFPLLVDRPGLATLRRRPALSLKNTKSSWYFLTLDSRPAHQN